MSENPTISRAELAGLLSFKPSQATRRIRRLMDEQRFPRPLPGVPTVWSRPRVLDWINRNGIEPANDIRAPAGRPEIREPVDGLAAARARLQQRYGAERPE